ncbi:MAG: hypothetical protein ACRD6N_17615, partial [Pyrinomonadaceae bacterium]
GRLFTSPTRDNRQIDIVIAVTPRVLRAPAVTPRDEEMRPSGTLQSPTTGSLAEMIKDSDREDALAAARRLPRNPTVMVRDVEPAPFSPSARAEGVAKNVPTNTANTVAAPATGTPPITTANAKTNPPAPVAPAETQAAKAQTPVEELPAFVPAPKSLVSDRSAAQVAAVNPGQAGNADAVLTSIPKPIESSMTTRRSRTALLSLTPVDQVLTVGEKRQFAVELESAAPLGLAVVTLRFDPKVVKVRAVSAGSLFSKENSPSITQSIDPAGVCLISISTLNGKTPMSGNGALVFIEIEALAGGDAALVFDKETMHLVATDARDVVLDVKHGRTTVKQ